MPSNTAAVITTDARMKTSKHSVKCTVYMYQYVDCRNRNKDPVIPVANKIALGQQQFSEKLLQARSFRVLPDVTFVILSGAGRDCSECEVVGGVLKGVVDSHVQSTRATQLNHAQGACAGGRAYTACYNMVYQIA